ncbi:MULTISPECIES: DUF2933 domain-containing protein [Bacteria]|jgi:hypothetical protein|uniref:DUF2933 domain-containing protein n=1 Tax=Pseudomonas knackmussii TaxID=65741 RepID=A0ABY4KP28_9PSED|nr:MULTISPECIES: DUF2933 domain-containing protein [Bacteria]MCB2426205.1 DUF2933 domain-containing protein [Methylophaga pinxianii]UPH47293.1 DUF2933 domain-containing protein [Methylophaga pinxianii]UPQ81398.1 DUF2933 domain-containing protein [Pseudomonas knackmussii]
MNKHSGSFWLTSKGLAAIGLIGAASYFLLIEHRDHVLPFLPYLILLACPLMHLFMHGRHGHHHSEETQSESSSHAPHRFQGEAPRVRGGQADEEENNNAR